MNYEEEITQPIRIGLAVATFLLNIGHALKAIDLCKESLVLLTSNKALSIGKQLCQLIHQEIYCTMFDAYRSISDHTNAMAYGRKLLAILCEGGDTVEGGWLSILLAQRYRRQKMSTEAIQLLERPIPAIETTDKRREACAYGELGNELHSVGEYVKAIEYWEIALAISMEIGVRAKEATCCTNLGTVLKFLGEYATAREYYKKALAISMEMGDRAREVKCCTELGSVLCSLGEYVDA